MLLFIPRSRCALQRVAPKSEHACFGATQGIRIALASGMDRRGQRWPPRHGRARSGAARTILPSLEREDGSRRHRRRLHRPMEANARAGTLPGIGLFLFLGFFQWDSFAECIKPLFKVIARDPLGQGESGERRQRSEAIGNLAP